MEYKRREFLVKTATFSAGIALTPVFESLLTGCTFKEVLLDKLHEPRGSTPGAGTDFTGGIASIWTQKNPDNEKKDIVRAIQGYMNWQMIQPDNPDDFNWTGMDSLLEKAAILQKPMMLQINGNHPEWMSDEVPYLNFVTRGIKAYQFWHPVYIRRYKDLLLAFAGRIYNHPNRKWIAGVRIQANAFNTEAWNWEFNNSEAWNQALKQLSGKNVPKPAEPDNPVNWVIPPGVVPGDRLMKRGDNSLGKDYLKQIINIHKEYFHPRNIPTFCRIEWYHDENLGAWLDDNYWGESMAGILETSFGLWQAGGRSIRNVKKLTEQYDLPVYTEDVQGTDERKNAKSREREIYWRQILKLHCNVKWSATYMGDLNNTGQKAWDEGFEMFNRYSGKRIHPASAAGAFLVFATFNKYGDGETIDNIGYFIRQTSPDAMVDLNDIGKITDHYGQKAKKLTGQELLLGVDKQFAEIVKGRRISIRVTSYAQNQSEWKIRIRRGSIYDEPQPDHEEGESWVTRTYLYESSGLPGNGQDDLIIEKTGINDPVFHKVEILPEK